AIFFSRWERAEITSTPSKFMTNWRQTTASPLTGATRRYSKRPSVLKRKTTAPAHARRFTKSWTIPQLRDAHTDNVSSSGTTRPDLMPRGFWRKIRNGSPRLQFTSAWQRRVETEVMKPRPG